MFINDLPQVQHFFSMVSTFMSLEMILKIMGKLYVKKIAIISKACLTVPGFSASTSDEMA
jgi:hypothetical protein